MHYGDYAQEDDIEKIEFERDANIRAVGYRKGNENVDFEEILRSHSRSGVAAIQMINKVSAVPSK